ncbi:MAG: hypothetical protein ACYDAY_01905 [Candidatus Dormibacteria bacterium]
MTLQDRTPISLDAGRDAGRRGGVRRLADLVAELADLRRRHAPVPGWMADQLTVMSLPGEPGRALPALVHLEWTRAEPYITGSQPDRRRSQRRGGGLGIGPAPPLSDRVREIGTLQWAAVTAACRESGLLAADVHFLLAEARDAAEDAESDPLGAATAATQAVYDPTLAGSEYGQMAIQVVAAAALEAVHVPGFNMRLNAALDDMAHAYQQTAGVMASHIVLPALQLLCLAVLAQAAPPAAARVLAAPLERGLPETMRLVD